MIHPSPDELTRFADGVSSASERERVAEHVLACPSCREALGAWARVEELLTEEEVQAPAGYFEDLPKRLVARLASSQGEKTAESERVSEVGSSTDRAFGTRVASFPVRRPRVARWVFAAAAVLFVAVLAPWTLRRRLEEPSLSRSVSGTATRPGPGAAPQLAAPGAGPGARTPATRASAPSALPPSDAARQEDRAKRNDEAKSDAGFVDHSPSPPNESERQSSERKREAAPLGVQDAALERDAVAKGMDGAPAPASKAAALEPAEPPPAPPAAPKADSAEGASGSRLAGELAPTGSAGPLGAARERARAFERVSLAAADPVRADEARVLAVEAWSRAWEVGGEASDREAAVRSARAYLERSDAQQPARVWRILRALGAAE